jgi:hypothetical protein
MLLLNATADGTTKIVCDILPSVGAGGRHTVLDDEKTKLNSLDYKKSKLFKHVTNGTVLVIDSIGMTTVLFFDEGQLYFTKIMDGSMRTMICHNEEEFNTPNFFNVKGLRSSNINVACDIIDMLIDIDEKYDALYDCHVAPVTFNMLNM